MDSLRRKLVELGLCLSVGLGSHFFSLGLGCKPFTTSLAPAYLLPYGSCAARSSHTELKIGSEGPPLLTHLWSLEDAFLSTGNTHSYTLSVFLLAPT